MTGLERRVLDAVDVAGPGDVRRAHAPDEFVPIAELVAATRALALTILWFCDQTMPRPEA